MNYRTTKINAVETNHEYSLTVDSVNLRCNFGFHGLKTGIVPLLQTFGKKLLYGKFTQSAFLTRYSHNFNGTIQQLTEADSNWPWVEQARLAFYLLMCRTALTESWRYPALISRDPDGNLDQETGMSRAFASMLTQSQPWVQYPVLLLDNCEIDSDMFQDGTTITSDRQLHEIFGIDFNTEVSHRPKTQIYFHVRNFKNQPYLRLNYIGNGTWHDSFPIGANQLWTSFLAWRKKFERPTIKVWTNGCKLLNTNDFWQVTIEPISSDLAIMTKGSPGYLDTAVRKFHANHRGSMTTDYEIWLTTPEKFDLANLIPWMTMDHNVFHDREYSFLLYRPDSEFKSTEISVHTHAQ